MLANVEGWEGEFFGAGRVAPIRDEKIITHTPDLYLLFASSTVFAWRMAVLLNALRAI